MVGEPLNSNQMERDGERLLSRRDISDAEKRYAINELELLEVKWAVEIGRKFRVETDHKALIALFGRRSQYRI